MEIIRIKRGESTGHIMYLKKCLYCQSEFWARKINGSCCTNSCRNLLMNQKKKNKTI
jgi:hypothetical protein